MATSHVSPEKNVCHNHYHANSAVYCVLIIVDKS